MRQLHVVPSIARNSGGLGLAALRFAQAQALADNEVTLYVAQRCTDELVVSAENGQINIVGPDATGFWREIVALRRCLKGQGFDVVHIHGSWTPILAIATYLARRHGVPVVVSPHGCLEPFALNHRGLKKKVALVLYQRRVFQSASMMIATAKQELDSIRRIGIQCPVAVIPLGVDIAESITRSQGPERRFLFLSRLHPIKGLHDLVSAWAMVRRPGWRLIVAGPSEDGYLAEIQSQIRRYGIEDDFYFEGLVGGERKESLFSQADIFVLPTYSENFGLVIGEALTRGVPVITTTEAPWSDIPVFRCGWRVKPGADSIAQALEAGMDSTRDELREMGLRGAQLIRDKYSWEKVGHAALESYRWLLGSLAEQPACVFLGKKK